MAKLPRGSGCGPSGWKYEHLKVLSSNCVIADSFFSVCDLIAKGSFPSSVSGLLSGSRLIALPKTGGDIRPIAIGECLRRVTAKVICRQKKESFATYFEPIQHGVAVEGGTERLVHHVNLLLESHDDWVLLKSDIKNAFNSIERALLLPMVKKSFPDIFEHVQGMYSEYSHLVFQQGSESFLLSSQGVQQGNPLGPFLFFSHYPSFTS